MQSIRKFITADGTEFTNAADAKAHEAVCAKTEKVTAIKAKLQENEEVKALEVNFANHEGTLTEFLAEHAASLKNALNEATVQRRGPRQPKAAE